VFNAPSWCCVATGKSETFSMVRRPFIRMLFELQGWRLQRSVTLATDNFLLVLNVHKAAGLPLRDRQMVPANSIHSSEIS
jgi:hypothetical protein